MTRTNEKSESKCFFKNLLICTFLLSLCGRADAGDIGGRWTMNANGHIAILLIASDGGSGTYEYVNWYDCASGNMENFTVSGLSVSWDRVCLDSTKNQHYEAELSENLCEIKNGFFTFKGSNYTWSASKDDCVKEKYNLGAIPNCQ